jgi:hypothetical protein
VDLLKRTVADGVCFKYAVADELYGRTCGFRQELADLGLLCVVEAPRDTTGWTRATGARGGDARRVDPLWRRGGPSWEAYHAKDTEKGPVVWEARAARFRPHESGSVGAAGEEQWLLVRRNVLTGEVRRFLSNAPEATPCEAVLRVALTRCEVSTSSTRPRARRGPGASRCVATGP